MGGIFECPKPKTFFLMTIVISRLFYISCLNTTVHSHPCRAHRFNTTAIQLHARRLSTTLIYLHTFPQLLSTCTLVRCLNFLHSCRLNTTVHSHPCHALIVSTPLLFSCTLVVSTRLLSTSSHPCRALIVSTPLLFSCMLVVSTRLLSTSSHPCRALIVSTLLFSCTLVVSTRLLSTSLQLCSLACLSSQHDCSFACLSSQRDWSLACLSHTYRLNTTAIRSHGRCVST
ncbi:hypothetical protein EV361DRAFT_391116 [Lentinula raphanica]|nr:hypothetical protein EV361DRAFT_391116 [Lentinula raphanica]